ncbi:PREDICTED: uncharacterized protein LOC108774946 [Cyphomyrmex costatus]|uniref:uncharacterized protein LOC108774946 n=1 Tax=Cyphomyrmex costatus TaxID=456900 RepID=UPI0008523F1A|nr:PREDICTED: uncharacterized protein LOC108774946 [Cyphomyrmex costatus]
MDDVNINEICLNNDMEVVQLDGDEDDWIKLNWIIEHSDNGNNLQSPETPEKDSDNEIAQTKDNDSKVSCTNTESEDMSDGISVITESDTDVVNTNRFQICQFNRKPCKSPQILELQINKQKDIWNILIAYMFGVIVGVTLSYFFINIMFTYAKPVKTYPVSNGIDVENLKTASHNIVNTCEELTDVKTMLNEIKAHMPTDIKITEQILTQFFEITDSSSKTNNKPIVFDPIVLNFLQYNSDKMHITSKSLLANLVEKMSKVILKVYNKYAKEKHRLNKTLCHLKSILPDDKFLKQLTKNNQLFKDHDKFCFSNYPNILLSKNLDSKTTTQENTKNVKEHTIKTDDTVIENMNKLGHQLRKKLYHLKNILHNNEFLKQLIEDGEEDIKESFKFYEEKNVDLQSDVMSKNGFDNILMQMKNTCPLSTSYCPKFNINMSTLDTVPIHKTKNYEKYNTNSKRTVVDHENSAKNLRAKGENRPKKKEYFNSNGFTKKIINDKVNYKKKYISSQNKIKNHISEHTVNYHTSKHSSFDNHAMKQENQHYINTNERNDNERSYRYNKYRQPDDSDWYFRRVYSRRNARRHTKQVDDSDWYFGRVYSRRNARRCAKYVSILDNS